jgi:hypothetical protein
MKTFFLLFISIIIFNGNIYSQTAGWSTVTRLTNSMTMDRHPSIPQISWTFKYPKQPLVLAFDRTDSSGTNICIMKTSGEGWAPETQYLTKGNGYNEYPSTSDTMIVFQKREKSCSNIYSILNKGNKWSDPIPFTNDSNKFNLHPRIYHDINNGPYIGLVWERDKKIYFKMANSEIWLDERKVTPEDTFSYSNPVIAYINIAFEKKIDSTKQYIYAAYPSGNTFVINPIDTTGYNRNPQFINGYLNHLTWEKKENGKWKIYVKYNVDFYDPRNQNILGIGDSVYNYNNFAGITVDLPNLNKTFKEINKKDISYFRTYSCLCIRNKDSIDEVLAGSIQPEQSIFRTKANNPTISQIYMGGGRHRVWAVWESEKDGYINLHGASYDILPAAVGEQKDFPEYELYQNFPNPFNPSTVISYSVGTQHAVSVQIKIFDILGREVKTLVNEYKAPGKYSVLFDGKDLSSGVYFCRLIVKDKNGSINTIKQIPMMMVK